MLIYVRYFLERTVHSEHQLVNYKYNKNKNFLKLVQLLLKFFLNNIFFLESITSGLKNILKSLRLWYIQNIYSYQDQILNSLRLSFLKIFFTCNIYSF